MQIREIACSGPSPCRFERVIADVRHDDDARSAVLRDRSSHRADRSESRDCDGRAGEIADLRRVYSVAEGVEKGADAKGDVRPELDDIRGWDFNELRKCAVAVQTENSGARTDVTLTRSALRAFAADNVHLGRDVIADAEVLALRAFAEALNESTEFVAIDSRWLEALTDRRIPVVDVLVGAADGGSRDANQNLIGSGLRYGAIANLGSGCTVNRRGLDDGLHGERPRMLSEMAAREAVDGLRHRSAVAIPQIFV